jgi:hypothetical protein
MEIRKIQTEEVDKIVDILCDICGESCWDSAKVNFEFLKLDSHWGFWSNKDLEHWSAQICEKCVDKHLKSLIKFNIKEY